MGGEAVAVGGLVVLELADELAEVEGIGVAEGPPRKAGKPSLKMAPMSPRGRCGGCLRRRIRATATRTRRARCSSSHTATRMGLSRASATTAFPTRAAGMPR